MKLKSIENKIKEFSTLNFPYTNVIGLARSILAFGTMLTLLTNNTSVLIQRSSEGNLFNPMLNPMAPLNKFNFFLLFGVEHFSYMKILAIAILIIVITGYFIKVTSLLHWWVSISFFFCSSVIDGGDQITAILTFLLLPLCLTDKRKNHWETIKPYSSTLNIVGLSSIYLIKLQIAIIYFHAAVGKFDVEEWANGTALYYWFNHSFFGASDNLIPIINFSLSNSWLVTASTYGVLIFEVLLFLCLLASEKVKRMVLIPAILFHFLIIIFHGIFSFFFAVTAGLILYLLPINKPLKFKI